MKAEIEEAQRPNDMDKGDGQPSKEKKGREIMYKFMTGKSSTCQP